MKEHTKEKFVDLKEQRQTKELSISKREVKGLTPVFAIIALLGYLLAGICWLNGGSIGSGLFMFTTDQCGYSASGIAAIAIFCYSFPMVKGKLYDYFRARK